MAQKSLFSEYIEKMFPSLGNIVEKINGKPNAPVYLHKQMLTKEYSVDQKWNSGSADTTYVTADVVAMDSPLPIKKRDRISVASGKLPKVGSKRRMTESDFNAVDLMRSRGDAFTTIVSKLAEDPVKVAVGIDEKNEANFLQALSDGVVLVDDGNNTGTGLRIDFGYRPENTFGVETAGHISENDISRIIDAAEAKGRSFAFVEVSKALLNKIRHERWAQEMVASYRGLAFTAETQLQTPGLAIFKEAFADRFNGIQIDEIDRQVISEKNGQQTTWKPFNVNRMVFIPSKNVGKLVWGTLAEMNHPVEGVIYQTVDQYKLISRFGNTDPMEEITAGQALVLPVIENVDAIYILDATMTDGSEQTENDSNFDFGGHQYVKSEVMTAYAAVTGATLANNITDANLQKAINSLNKSSKDALIASLVYLPELNPTSLSFTASADATGKTFTVGTNDKTNTPSVAVAAAASSWLSASRNETTGVVTVTVGANGTSAKRTGDITVTVGTKTATLTVEQAG